MIGHLGIFLVISQLVQQFRSICEMQAVLYLIFFFILALFLPHYHDGEI
jgi:hypothetical protein